YLGYTFNPVSFYYCYDSEGCLQAVLAEVNNTFGGRQNYWLTQDQSPGTRHLARGTRHPAPDRAPIVRRYSRHKAMYVSPFMAMDQVYTFALTEPCRRLVAHMTVEHHAGKMFDATLVLDGVPWSARALTRALVSHPWMTGKVIGAIHWEAVKLYLR